MTPVSFDFSEGLLFGSPFFSPEEMRAAAIGNP